MSIAEYELSSINRDVYFSLPTRFYYVEKWIDTLRKELVYYSIKSLILVFGRNHALESGIIFKIEDVLEFLNIDYYKISGVGVNPSISDLIDNADRIGYPKYDLILAVGGGSVIDFAKGLSAYKSSKLNIKPLRINHEKNSSNNVDECIPVACISTYPSSGSEVNGSFVIKDLDGVKRAMNYPMIRPLFTITSYDLVKSLTSKQLKRSISDIMGHLFEQYFSSADFGLTDRIIVEILIELFNLTDNFDFHLKSNEKNLKTKLIFLSIVSLSYIFQVGRDTDWIVHEIEHLFSAFSNGNHSEGIAFIMPRWIDYSSKNPYYKLRLKFLANRLGFQSIKEVVSAIYYKYETLYDEKKYCSTLVNSFTLSQLNSKVNLEFPMGKVSLLSKDEFSNFINLLIDNMELFRNDNCS